MERTQRQRQGVEKWFNNNCNGIFEWAPGVGKTYGALIASKRLFNINPNIKILVSVPTEVLKNQWLKDINKTIFKNNFEVQIVNSIINKNWDVDLLIIDEIHKVASPSFINIFKQVKYKYILGLTGTLERLDGKQKLIYNYVKSIDQITMKEALINKWLSPNRNYKVLIDVNLDEYNEANREFNDMFSFFDYKFNIAMACATGKPVDICARYSKIMGVSTGIVKGKASKWMKLLRKRKLFVISHPKKFELANKILSYREEKKAITFSATIKDSKSFKGGFLLNSKLKKKENEITIDTFNKLSIGSLHTNRAADEGLDVKGLNLGIIISCNSSSIQMKQRLGRIQRFEKDKISEMFTLVIKNTVEETWYANSSKDIDCITIDEDQLQLILEGELIVTKPRNDISCKEFRF